jgi:hypothetical protein
VTIFFDWIIMGGSTIIPHSPRPTRNEKNFQDRPQNFNKKSYMTLKYLLIIDFDNKFEPLTAADLALCGNLGPKCQNLFPLV